MMSCVIISSFKRREFFRTGTSNLLKNGLSVVAAPHILCGRSVVCGPRPRGKEELRPFIYHCTALHVFLRLSSLPLRVVLFVRFRLLLSETESSVIGTKRTTHGRFSLVGHRPSSSWHIHYRYCIERVEPHTSTYATRLLETGPTVSFLRILLRLNYLAKRERERT